MPPPIIGSDSVIYSGPNRVKMENIGPKYPWLGQHSMDWTQKRNGLKNKTNIIICIYKKNEN